ncbi:hypothetical protein BH10BAC5_BH10BAC5_06500 [soil metagenome]
MKLLNTFFVALFLLSTLIYLTGCDKTNTLVYTPVGKQYATNQFNIASLYANGTVVIADADLTNSYGVTIGASTDINFLAHLPGVPASRDTIYGQFTFKGVKDSLYHLNSDTTQAFGVLVVKTTDTTSARYYSINGASNNLTINSYGILGEYINGTFTGQFVQKTGVSDTITVTNGQFSCYRRQ